MKRINVTGSIVAWSVFFALSGFASSVLATPDNNSFNRGMQAILNDYLKIHNVLAADSIRGIQKPANTIAKSAKRLDLTGLSAKHKKLYKDIPKVLSTAANELSKSSDLKQAREAFKVLSRPMALWGTAAAPVGINVLFCSMANASWLQKEGEVRNPYYGKSMLNCGERVKGTDNPADSYETRSANCNCKHGTKTSGHHGHGAGHRHPTK